MRYKPFKLALVVSALWLTVCASAIFGGDFRKEADLVIGDLIKERFESVVSAFTPWLAQRHSAAELEEAWYKSIERYGYYATHNFGKTIDSDTAVSYLYVIELQKAALAAILSYDDEGRIMSFILQPPEGEPIISQPLWVMPAFPEREKVGYSIPDYVDTAIFNESEIVMHGATPIPATITAAMTDEPNPVVLLFQGFGPTDRDETNGSLKPLRDIAWGLASRGIASIRFDSRSYTQSPDTIAGYNLDQYLLDDLAAMLAYIRMETAIFDTTRIFIAAHGLGGMAAPLAVQRDGGLAGMILLSTPARQFGDMLLEWVKSDLAENAADTVLEKKTLNDVAAILTGLNERALPPDEMILFAPAQVWYDLSDNDHVRTTRELEIPIFIVHSGRDIQATDTDYDIWRKGSAERTNVTLKRYDDLNHYYQKPGQGSAGKYYFQKTNEPVDIRVIKDLAGWIKSQ